MAGMERKVRKILREAGYEPEKQPRGSHTIWDKNGQNEVSVPAKIMSRHTANDILKAVGLPKKF